MLEIWSLELILLFAATAQRVAPRLGGAPSAPHEGSLGVLLRNDRLEPRTQETERRYELCSP